MTNINEMYKCSVCGNLVSVIENGVGKLVCCGKEMDLLIEKVLEEGTEKHKPVLIIEGNNVTVKVGSIPHPMEEKHYIELVELFKYSKLIASKRLYHGDLPEVTFCIDSTEGLTACALCNVHGLWKN